MATLLGGWDRIRRWIDNEPDDSAPETIQKTPDNQSESELFLHRLLQEIEAVLRNEIVRVPNTNKAYAPEKFVVYLSDATDKKLRRDKREFFEQELSAMIFERAREMVGNLQLTAQNMSVEISVDPTLVEEIEVRAAAKSEFETVKSTDDIEVIVRSAAPVNEESNAQISNDFATVKNELATVEDVGAQFEILYHVEIWQGNRRINEYPIIQRKNTIGRDDGQKAANLRLPSENLKISRFHAEIELNENNEVWVKSLHKNPTIVSGQVISNGEQAKLGVDGEIIIYDFTLKLKF